MTCENKGKKSTLDFHFHSLIWNKAREQKLVVQNDGYEVMSISNSGVCPAVDEAGN